MTDHDALLRAICEHPAEDTPRLAFADWLDENADALANPAAERARAAFIRDDIAMSSRDEYDPARLRWELIEKPRREREPWVEATLPPGAARTNLLGAPLLKRGFPWGTGCTPDRFLAGTGFPFELVPVTTYVLHGPHIATDTLLHSPRLAGLTGLVIGHRANLWPRQLRALSDSRHTTALEGLHAGEGGLAQQTVAAFPRMPLFTRLKRLSLARARGAGFALAANLRPDIGPVRLHDLDVSGTGLTGTQAVPLFTAGAARGLTRLALTACPLGQAGHAALAGADLPHLRDLDVSNTALGAYGLRVFAASPVAAGLHRFACRANSVTGGALVEFVNRSGASNLRALDLSSNAIGNAGATAIAQSPHLADLLVLNLSYCMVGDDGAEAILESPLADGLVLLDLTVSPMSAEMKETLKARMGDRVRV